MRHRIKKIPSLISKYKSLHHRLLHSDKSTYDTYGNNTYFYKTKYFLKQHFPYSKPKTIPLAVPAMSMFALLLVLGLMVFPIGVNGFSSSKAYATWYGPDDTTSGSGDGSGSGSDGSSSVAITMLADDPIEQETPTEAGKATYRYNRFTVSADSVKSYKMFVYAADGYTNQLVNKPEGSEVIATVDTINSTANPNGVVGSSITADSWGYTITKGNVTEKADLEKLTYYSVGENAEVSPAISEDNSPTLSNSPFTVAFVANISKDKPAGHYQTEVLLSVAVEPEEVVSPTTPVTNWNDLTYMQQMSSVACESASVNDTKQLIDTRDQKTYWVTKLNDGNCWMTQNLDLDLYVDGANRTLTPEDSNVTENWPSADKPGTGPSTKEGYHSSSSGYYKAQYYDPGYAYYTNNGTTKNDLSEVDGKALATTTSGDTNAHSLQGNLYSWTAATAGSGGANFTDSSSPGWPEASSSICPKGWKLPTSNNTDVTKKSFGGLTSTYGISNNSTGSNTMRSTPFYFIYSGYVRGSSLGYAGSSGLYWSSTARSSDNAYELSLDSGTANPSSYPSRYSGQSVRCVAE